MTDDMKLTADRALGEFSADMLDEVKCREFVIGCLHEEPRCPHCSVPVAEAAMARWKAMAHVTCRHCGKSHNAATGTALASVHARFSQVVAYLVLARLGLSNPQAARKANIHRSTAAGWAKKFGVADR